MEGGSITDDLRFHGAAPDAVEVDGAWTPRADCIEFAGPGSGRITIINTARRVDLVLSSSTSSPIVVAVNEDGPPLDREWCGDDCREDPELGASCQVEDRRAYWITRRDEPEHHELTIEVDEPGLRIHEARFS